MEVLARAGLFDLIFVLRTKKIRTIIARVLPVIDTVAFLPHVRDFFGNKSWQETRLIKSACRKHSSSNIEMHTHMLTAVIEEGYHKYTEGSKEVIIGAVRTPTSYL